MLPRKYVLPLVVLLIVIVLLPITYFAVKKKQELRGRAAQTKAPETVDTLSKDGKPEYVPGEVLVKFKIQSEKLKIKAEKAKAGIDVDKTPLDLADLDTTDAETGMLANFLKEQGVLKLEKVFKGSGDPKEDVAKFKARFPKRASQVKPEAEKIDLSRTYKLSFEREGDVLQKVETLSQNSKLIKYAEPNYIFHQNSIPDDPLYNDHFDTYDPLPDSSLRPDPTWNPPHDYQWNLRKINMEQAWALSTGSSDTIIAVIDGGIDPIHEDFDSDNIMLGTNFIDPAAPPLDDSGHGSHVAGIIAAKTDNATGMAGINWQAKILAIKVCGFWSCFLDRAAAGLYEAVEKGAIIANFSLTFPSPCYLTQTGQNAVNYAGERGVIIVHAFGNENHDRSCREREPKSPFVIEVGATDENDKKARYSNYGVNIDVVAPGGDTPTNLPNLLSINAHMPNDPDHYVNGGHTVLDAYSLKIGTSMAAPHVSGLVSLILSKNPDFSAEQTASIIRASAEDIVDPFVSGDNFVGFDKYTGYGRINAERALSINNPLVLDFLNPKWGDFVQGVVNITAKISGISLVSYELSVGEGREPENWQVLPAAINEQGIVTAVWNTTNIRYQTYTLKLTAISNEGFTFEERTLVIVSNLLHSGWPVDTPDRFNSTPAVGDIDTNYPGKEIVAYSDQSNLYIWHSDGTIYNTFAIFTSQSDYYPSYPPPSPVLADLDTESTGLEIIIVDLEGKIHALHADGSEVAGNWPITTDLINTRATPAVADILPDLSGLEIVALGRTTTGRTKLYLFNNRGEMITEFNTSINSIGVSPPVLTDIDEQFPGLEIIIGGQNKIYGFHHNGIPVDRWPITTSGSIVSPIAVAEINKDIPGYETVAATNGRLGEGADIYLIQSEGNAVWSNHLPNEVLSGSVIANIDTNTEAPEILISTYGDTNSGGQIFIFRSDGTLFNNWSVSKGHRFVATPAVGEIDPQAPGLEIIAATYSTTGDVQDTGKVFVFRNDGRVVDDWPIPVMFARYSSPVITDLDGNGHSQIVFLSNNGSVFVIDEIGQYVSQEHVWPQFQHDERHTGAYAAPETVEKGTIFFPGWNRVGLPLGLVEGFSGKSLLEELGRVCGNVKFEAIGAVENEKWSEYVSQFGGEDFQIAVNKDYWLKTDGYCLYD